MKAAALVPALFGLLASSPVLAQRRVDPRASYERVRAVLPMTGSGTLADPRRPLFAPASLAPRARSGILGFTFVPSDDGRYALCEFAAVDRAALLPILNDRTPGVRVFERGRHSRAEMEAEFRRLKRDFDFSRFGVRLP